VFAHTIQMLSKLLAGSCKIWTEVTEMMEYSSDISELHIVNETADYHVYDAQRQMQK
jgi:hypothetical protein